MAVLVNTQRIAAATEELVRELSKDPTYLASYFGHAFECLAKECARTEMEFTPDVAFAIMVMQATTEFFRNGDKDDLFRDNVIMAGRFAACFEEAASDFAAFSDKQHAAHERAAGNLN